ncbi:FecR family protein [Chitinophaga solisilvae]|uniref:FecR family protein n=1 Tax=Chitinophaga solisilvae TaxID=1233460 RepID=UPI00136ED80D|nr:FecR family protein [Chitinophaga solisilvae]
MSHPDQHIIRQLLERHALGICTPEERAILERWYASFPGEGPVFHDQTEKQEVKASLKAGIFGALQATTSDIITLPLPQEQVHTAVADNAAPGKRAFRRMYWRAAAAVLILLAAGTFFYVQRQHPQPVSYTTVSAPAGGKVYHLQLPDGSAVWLQPGSTIRYADGFGKQRREVQLVDGLAYFAVVPAATHPFLVSAPSGIKAKVLGTEFSVKAYNGLPSIEIYVESGSVQVADSSQTLGILTAGQHLEYRQVTQTATRSEGHLDDWRRGNLTLQHVSFAEVARILQNRYQAQVIYDATRMSPYRFNLQISGNATLEETLEMLKALSGMTYKLNNRQVTVTGIQQ